MKTLQIFLVMATVVLMSASGLFAQAGVGLVPLEGLDTFGKDKPKATTPDSPDKPAELTPLGEEADDPEAADDEDSSDALSQAAPLPKVSQAPKVNPYFTIGLAFLMVLLVMIASFKPAKRSHLD